MVIRKAGIADVPVIQSLVKLVCAIAMRCCRALSCAIYEDIRDFYVAEQDGLVVGCCALHVTWGGPGRG